MAPSVSCFGSPFPEPMRKPMNRPSIRTLFLVAAICVATILPLRASFADTVLYDSAGFIQGQQSFVQSFNITTAGTLTLTLSNIPWLDTISGLNCFFTTSSGALGAAMGVGTDSISVGPGMLYAHWFGEAGGLYGVGVYGLKLDFSPNSGPAPVPLPMTLILLLSGLAMMWFWPRRQNAMPAF